MLSILRRWVVMTLVSISLLAGAIGCVTGDSDHSNKSLRDQMEPKDSNPTMDMVFDIIGLGLSFCHP